MDDALTTPGAALLAIIDELLTDSGTEPILPSSTDPRTSLCDDTTVSVTAKPQVSKKKTRTSSYKTVLSRMEIADLKRADALKKSKERWESQRLKQAHPVISQLSKDIQRPPLYLRAVQLEKELRMKREQIHLEKLEREKEAEDLIVTMQKDLDLKAKAKLHRTQEEFFEFNAKMTKRREAELEAERKMKEEKVMEELVFQPEILQKSRFLSRHKPSLFNRLEEETRKRSLRKEALRKKYAPSFHPTVNQGWKISGCEEEVFSRLYRKRRRSGSIEPSRISTNSPPRTSRTTIITLDDPIDEEPNFS